MQSAPNLGSNEEHPEVHGSLHSLYSQGSHKIPGLPDSTSQGLANKLTPPHLAKNFTLTSIVRIPRPFVLSWDMHWELILPSLKSACWLAVEIGFC